MSISHPVWKGHIRFALVTLPVDLYAARDSTAKPGFRQIHEPSGLPVNYDKVVPGIGPVQENEILRGYETGKGQYVLLTDHEIDSVQLESRRAVELAQFVDPREIDPLFYDKAYFVRPSAESAEAAYKVLRDALAVSGKSGIGQISLRGREYLAAVRAYEDGMILETLFYRDEVRDSEPYFAGMHHNDKTDPDLLDLAVQLVAKKTTEFDPDTYVDNYAVALRQLVDEKLASGSVAVRTGFASDSVTTEETDLLDALRKSVQTTRRLRQPKAKTRASVA